MSLRGATATWQSRSMHGDCAWLRDCRATLAMTQFIFYYNNKAATSAQLFTRSYSVR
jgi:hypothetical protein